MAGLATEEGALLGVEQETTADLGGVGGVASVAVLDEDRADVFLEEGKLVGGELGLRFGLRAGKEGGQQKRRKSEDAGAVHGIPGVM